MRIHVKGMFLKLGYEHGCTLYVSIACALHWRFNDHDGVSNHQPHGCLLNLLFRRWSKKTSKLPVTGLCVGTGEFPAQRASYAENVSIWWRHHGYHDISQITADMLLRKTVPQFCVIAQARFYGNRVSKRNKQNVLTKRRFETQNDFTNNIFCVI